jgi:hypothetical protein
MPGKTSAFPPQREVAVQLVCMTRVSSSRPAGMDQSQLPPETPQFVDRQPDVGQTDPRNRAANKVTGRNRRDPGILRHEEVMVPQRHPRKNKQADSHLEAEEDVNDSQGSVHAWERGLSFAPGAGAGTRSGRLLRLLLEGAYFLGDVAVVDVLAIHLGESLQGAPGVARLLIGHPQVILESQG